MEVMTIKQQQTIDDDNQELGMDLDVHYTRHCDNQYRLRILDIMMYITVKTIYK